jgi:hypothetical protein
MNESGEENWPQTAVVKVYTRSEAMMKANIYGEG